MSSKKKALGWADEILAGSDTPTGEFQWSQGSNYGLDGYHFDQPNGEGVRERPAQPGATPGPAAGSASALGMQSLPSDVMASADAPLDEAALMNDFEAGVRLGGMFTDASAVNLQWLDPTQPQDPDRLPQNPVDLGLAELEQAWGFGKRSLRVPAKDLAVEQYRQQMESPQPATPGPKLAAEDVGMVRQAVQKAVRDAHFGKSVAEIKRDLVAALGDQAVHTRGVVSRIKQDMGLAGNVFVRASAFPGIKNGKWVQRLKKKARQARYVITDDPSVGVKLGMIPVTEVPWDKAFTHYSPRLAAQGYGPLAGADPREALQAAFLAGPAAPEMPLQMPKPVEIRPADTVTTAQALEAFRTAADEAVPATQIEVNDGSKARRANALRKISKWMASGDLSSRQVFELRKLDTDDMLIRAAEMIAAPKQQTYEGSGLVQTQDAQMERQASRGTTKTAEFKRLASWARRAMNEGWMGNDLTQLIQARWSPQVLSAAAPELRQLRAKHEGLAGNVYVDAAAYASPTGDKGCKEASAKHRTNQVPRVLGMSRCGSCIHKKALPDGMLHCSIYNKPLIGAAELEGAPLNVIQDEAIRLSNASDAEVVGSLFTDPNTSIVEQFGLTSSMDVSLENTPSVEKLGEVLFGGIQLGEDD